MSLIDELEELEQRAREMIEGAETAEKLEAARVALMGRKGEITGLMPVSYTHLDVYKRQTEPRPAPGRSCPRSPFSKTRSLSRVNTSITLRSWTTCRTCSFPTA